MKDMTPIKTINQDIPWYRFDRKDRETYPPKGLYLVTVKYGNGIKCEAALWNAFGLGKWTGFEVSEVEGECEEIPNVIAYAPLPEPVK